MRDAVTVIERETIFVRKFADADARDRDEPEAVLGIAVTTEDGIERAVTSAEVRRGEPFFADMDRMAREQAARAKDGTSAGVGGANPQPISDFNPRRGAGNLPTEPV